MSWRVFAQRDHHSQSSTQSIRRWFKSTLLFIEATLRTKKRWPAKTFSVGDTEPQTVFCFTFESDPSTKYLLLVKKKKKKVKDKGGGKPQNIWLVTASPTLIKNAFVWQMIWGGHVDEETASSSADPSGKVTRLFGAKQLFYFIKYLLDVAIVTDNVQWHFFFFVCVFLHLNLFQDDKKDQLFQHEQQQKKIIWQEEKKTIK